MNVPCQGARDIHSKQLEGRNALHDCIATMGGSTQLLYCRKSTLISLHLLGLRVILLVTAYWLMS